MKIADEQFARETGSGFVAMRDYAKIIASLSPDAKQKVLSGGKLILAVKDLPASQANLVKDYFTQTVILEQKLRNEMAARMVASGDKYDSVLQTNPYEKTDLQSVKLEIAGDTGLSNQFFTGNNCLASRLDGVWRLNAFVKDLPKKTVYPDLPKSEYSKNLNQLDYRAYRNLPVLQTKLDVKNPKGVMEPAFKDVLAALSNASGYSIVCEDFKSQSRMRRLGNMFGSQVILGDLLSNIGGFLNINWFIDEENKLLLGSDFTWTERHPNLVPDSLLTNLKEKMDGDGAYLDDFVVIKCLSRGQYDDWVGDSRDFSDLWWQPEPAADIFWKLYASLSAEDKALAVSPSGLPLSKPDPKLVITAFGDASNELKDNSYLQNSVGNQIYMALKIHPEIKDEVNSIITARVDSAKAMGEETEYMDLGPAYDEILGKYPELKKGLQYPTDPTSISKLTMYVRASEQGPISYNKRASYKLSIEGEDYKLEVGQTGCPFPFFSMEGSNKQSRKEAEERIRKANKQQ